jgi:hypothetical protein
MMKRGGTAIFLLGVSGVSLSIAMFLDSYNKPDFVPAKEEEVEDNEEPLSFSPALPAKITRQANATLVAPLGEPMPLSTNVSYRQRYLDNVQKQEQQYWKENSKDFTYRGDGSRYDKERYFHTDAYRRSREGVPVPAERMLSVRLSRLQEEADEDTGYSSAEFTLCPSDLEDDMAD